MITTTTNEQVVVATGILKKNNLINNNMNTQTQEMQEREPGVVIGKIHFEVLEIDVENEYADKISAIGNSNYDFNFKDLEDAEQFHISVVQTAIKQGSYNLKAATDLGNDILSQF